MFWGLNLKPNRKYSQTTTKSFHISQAALDVESSSAGSNQIYVSCENQKFLICTLRKDACEQVMLDLNFAEGDEICFQSIGSGNVTLSGYLIEDDSDNFLNGDEEDEEEEESDMEEMAEDLRSTLNKKAKAKKVEKAKTKGTATKAIKAGEDEEGDDDEEEDDSDLNVNEDEEGDDGDDDDDDEEDEDEDDDEDEEDEGEEDESEDEEVQQPKAKQPKLEKHQKQQNGVAKENAVVEKKDKKEKKEKKGKEGKQQQPQQQKTGVERVLSGGVKIVDVRVGNGPEAKSGKRVQVYYEGRLLSNNKVFDSLKTGAGFKFGLGRGEVIKGWDVGVVGMKVGGKRRITCPPHMAYGSRGSPPTIPPNSTLVFEVELKGIH